MCEGVGVLRVRGEVEGGFGVEGRGSDWVWFCRVVAGCYGWDSVVMI